MARSVKQVIIGAVAVGGVFAGVASASTPPAHGVTAMAAASAEERLLHATVVQLAAQASALDTALRADHGRAPVPVAVAPTVTATAPATGRVAGRAAPTVPSTAVGPVTVVADPSGGSDGPAAGSTPEPVTVADAPPATTTTTTTTEPATTTTTTEPATTTTTTRPSDDGGGGRGSDD